MRWGLSLSIKNLYRYLYKISLRENLGSSKPLFYAILRKKTATHLGKTAIHLGKNAIHLGNDRYSLG